jgi:hypothetical protein
MLQFEMHFQEQAQGFANTKTDRLVLVRTFKLSWRLVVDACRPTMTTTPPRRPKRLRSQSPPKASAGPLPHKRVSREDAALDSLRHYFPAKPLGHTVRDYQDNHWSMQVHSLHEAGGNFEIHGFGPSFYARFVKCEGSIECLIGQCATCKEKTRRALQGRAVNSCHLDQAVSDFWASHAFLEGDFGFMMLVGRIAEMLKLRIVAGEWPQQENNCDATLLNHLVLACSVPWFWNLLAKTTADIWGETCKHCGRLGCDAVLACLFEVAEFVAEEICCSEYLADVRTFAAHIITCATSEWSKSVSLVLTSGKLLYSHSQAHGAATIPKFTCFEPSGGAILFANEARCASDPFDTLVCFQNGAPPQTATNIRDIFAQALPSGRLQYLPIINHRAYQWKANDTPPSFLGLLRSLQVMVAASRLRDGASGMIFIWSGKYHASLFDSCFTESHLYHGRVQGLPSLPDDANLTAIVQMALRREASGMQVSHQEKFNFKAVVVSGCLHIALRNHPAYSDGLQGLRNEFPSIISQVQQMGLKLNFCVGGSVCVPELLGSLHTVSNTAQPMSALQLSHRIEMFLTRFSIQPHAKDLLRSRASSVQEMILHRSMRGVKNPTAVLMKWLEGQPHDVEAFVKTYAIGRHVADRLRSLPRASQQHAMHTSLTSAKDPTACLLKRIRSINGQTV